MSNTGSLIAFLSIMFVFIGGTVYFVRKGLRADKAARALSEVAVEDAVPPTVEDHQEIVWETLNDYGTPVEDLNPRKWLGYLLTGICLASGIGQMYWAVSIATTQMVGVYHRWKHDNYFPLSPSLIAIIGSIGVGLWIASKGGQVQQDRAPGAVCRPDAGHRARGHRLAHHFPDRAVPRRRFLGRSHPADVPGFLARDIAVAVRGGKRSWRSRRALRTRRRAMTRRAALRRGRRPATGYSGESCAPPESPSVVASRFTTPDWT
jgi:hypothetical protein